MVLYSSDIGLQFDETAENFDNYEERLMQFLAANKIEEDRRKAIFLSVVGPKTFALLKDFISPKQFREVTLASLLESLRNFYMPKKNVPPERFAFRSCRQQSGETFADYIASLKGLASTCDFGMSLEEQLRDQFVCGTSNNDLRRKLLNAAIAEGLTWQKMVEITNNFECTNAGLESMQKGQVSAHLRADHVGVRRPREPKAARTPTEKANDSNQDCYRCLGKGHEPGSCHFKEFQCHGCGRQGHLERACRSKRTDRGMEQERWPTGYSSAHPPLARSGLEVRFMDEGAVAREPERETYSAERQTDMRLYTVKTECDYVKPYKVMVKCNGNRMYMEVDTGAAMSVISESLYKSKLKGAKLQPCDVTLRTYTDQPLALLGKIRVNVQYGKRQLMLPLLVSRGKAPALMG